MYRLYLIYNQRNQKKYVGITSRTLEVRWREHLRNNKHDGQHPLRMALRKYGPENFTMTLLAETDDWDMLCQMEREAIAFHESFASTGHGYNLTRGGEGTLGVVATEEARQRMSQQRKGQRFPERTPAQRARYSAATKAYFETHPNPMQGRPQREETKAKIAAKAMGRTPWNKGRKTGPLSAEHRQRLSQHNRGRRSWNTGLKTSEEVRQKLSAGHAAHFAKTARPIIVEGILYRSSLEAMERTGYTYSQIKYRLKTGRAQWCPKTDAAD